MLRYKPPRPVDFVSDEQAGVRPAPWESADHRKGFSVWETQGQAREAAHALKKKLGLRVAYIGRIDAERKGPIRTKRTEKHLPGHHTMWADPEVAAKRARIVDEV